MRILLTGSNGQFGKTFRKFTNNFSDDEDYQLISITRKDLDLLDEDACRTTIEDINPDLIINAAAYTAVDRAEVEPDIAFAVNSKAPLIFAKVLLERGGKLIQLSTDFVFDGRSDKPYKTSDIVNPLNIYGSSKAICESSLHQLLGKSNQVIVLRSSWIFGPYGSNFAKTMLKLLISRDELKVVDNQISSPTSSISLARACTRLIKLVKEGNQVPSILHWSDSDTASRYDMAVFIAERGKELGLIPDPANIIPIKDTDYSSIAIRPSYSVLDSSMSSEVLKLGSISWRESLQEVLTILSKKNKL